MHILIINPNTSKATSDRMRAIGETIIQAPNELEVVSAPSGIELIETVKQSFATVPAVLSVVADRHKGTDAIIIAAFSDPGLQEARAIASCSVLGISEAAMRTAAAIGKRFSIITLGSELRETIKENARVYGFAENLVNVQILPWTVAEVSAAPSAHERAFAEACQRAVITDAVGSVIIGGGPLSGIADSIAEGLPVPILDGVRCAVQMALTQSNANDVCNSLTSGD